MSRVVSPSYCADAVGARLDRARVVTSSAAGADELRPYKPALPAPLIQNPNSKIENSDAPLS
jgi:hypothetical protein